MTPRLYVLLVLLVGGGLLTVGDVVFKYYALNPRISLYAIGLLIYLAGLVCLVESYKYSNIAVASAIFVMSNIVMLAIISWILFKEPLSPAQFVGIALSLAAIGILEH